jgi:hypothetical protein
MEVNMTILEAIGRTDDLKPNNFTELDKIRWLSELEWIVKRKVIDTHEGGENIIFNGYDETTNTEDVLIVSAPHDDIYLKWLEAKIDYHNGEYVKYNNSSVAFNNAYSEFANCYNRLHKPKQTKLKFF